jgi:ribosome maturation factor RimP
MNWQATVERTVSGLGYDLVDLERSGGGLLRVTIDKPAAGTITVDDCETVTRQLQYVLEVENVDYARLEVSSPGLDRPLKKAADYERFAGEAVDVTLKLPFQGRKKYSGKLVAREGGWRLLLDDEDKPLSKTRQKAIAKAVAKGEVPATVERALDFTLDEVREARLVPMVNFKGRAADEPRTDDTPADGPSGDGGQEE